MLRRVTLFLIIAALGGLLSAGEPPRVLPEDVSLRIAELDHRDFEIREQAARWLIGQRDRWRSLVPEKWSPAHPEARWRWRWIGRRVDQLDGLGASIGEDSVEVVATRIGRLRLEIGPAVADELTRLAMGHPRSRIRQRAVELLARLRPDDLADRLDPVALDHSPWVYRTVLDTAAVYDRQWLTRLLSEGLHLDPGDDENLSEVVRAIRIHRVVELVVPVRALWPDLGSSARIEASLLVSARPLEDDLEIFYWMIESGDYRVLVDGVRAFETVAGRQGLRDNDRSSSARSGPSSVDTRPTRLDLARFANATLASDFPEIRARARRWIEAHGNAGHALDLLHFLDAAHLDVRQFIAGRIAAWGAEDYYAELEDALLSWPPQERSLRLFTEDGLFRIVPIQTSFRGRD